MTKMRTTSPNALIMFMSEEGIGRLYMNSFLVPSSFSPSLSIPSWPSALPANNASFLDI